MNNRDALLDDLPFEDSFETGFGQDDSFGSSSGFSDRAPMPEMPDASMSETDALSGSVSVPQISIHAFCERAGTANVINKASQDRRLSRATVSIENGGLARALDVYREQSTPDLLIVESSQPAQVMLQSIDALAELCDPNIRVLVIGAMNDVQLYRQLVARGVSEYLVPPFKPVQLIQSIGSLYIDPDRPFLGRSISVIGAKGGVGASSISHNLAWSISESYEANATLIDLDLSWGTTSLDFNQEGDQTVADALNDPDRIDDAVLDKLLTKTTSRLSLFTAPSSLNATYDIDEEAYQQVIDQVRRNVPYAVLDLPHVWSDWMRSTLVNSDDVVLVCQPDLASLRNGKNLADFLLASRKNDSPPKLILNMVGVPKRPEIPVKDFAAAIGLEPTLVLPFEPALFGQATNNGQMISETAPDSKPAQGIDYLAGMLTGRSAIERRSDSLLNRVLKFGK